MDRPINASQRPAYSASSSRQESVSKAPANEPNPAPRAKSGSDQENHEGIGKLLILLKRDRNAHEGTPEGTGVGTSTTRAAALSRSRVASPRQRPVASHFGATSGLSEPESARAEHVAADAMPAVEQRLDGEIDNASQHGSSSAASLDDENSEKNSSSGSSDTSQNSDNDCEQDLTGCGEFHDFYDADEAKRSAELGSKSPVLHPNEAVEPQSFMETPGVKIVLYHAIYERFGVTSPKTSNTPESGAARLQAHLNNVIDGNFPTDDGNIALYNSIKAEDGTYYLTLPGSAEPHKFQDREEVELHLMLEMHFKLAEKLARETPPQADEENGSPVRSGENLGASSGEELAEAQGKQGRQDEPQPDASATVGADLTNASSSKAEKVNSSPSSASSSDKKEGVSPSTSVSPAPATALKQPKVSSTPPTVATRFHSKFMKYDDLGTGVLKYGSQEVDIPELRRALEQTHTLIEVCPDDNNSWWRAPWIAASCRWSGEENVAKFKKHLSDGCTLPPELKNDGKFVEAKAAVKRCKFPQVPRLLTDGKLEDEGKLGALSLLLIRKRQVRANVYICNENISIGKHNNDNPGQPKRFLPFQNWPLLYNAVHGTKSAGNSAHIFALMQELDMHSLVLHEDHVETTETTARKIFPVDDEVSQEQRTANIATGFSTFPILTFDAETERYGVLVPNEWAKTNRPQPDQKI